MKHKRAGRSDQGSSLIELMASLLVLVVVMAVVFSSIVETERSGNTVIARQTDASWGESLVNLLVRQVRSAQQVALSATTNSNTNPYTELWLASTPSSQWPYVCTVWTYESTAGELVAFASASQVTLTVTDPASLLGDAVNGIDGLRLVEKLPGVAPMLSTSQGLFADFANYPGLVDISMGVRYDTRAGQGSVQMGTKTPVMVEVEADDPNLAPLSAVGASGLPAFSSTGTPYPATCY